MPWPAVFNPTNLHDANAGTLYTSASNIPALIQHHKGAGQAWRFHKRFSTYCPSRKLSYKALESLKPADENDFQSIMESCQSAGMNPPTSFTDCFLRVCRVPFALPSVISPFRDSTFGGWQQRFFWPKDSEAWHYDINKAYRWAALQGLPDTRYAYKITSHFRYATEPCAVYLMEVEKGAIPYSPAAGVYLVTSEEWESLAFKPVRILTAFAFTKQVDLSESFGKIDTLFPSFASRIGRAFWGIWNSKTGPEVLTWKSGNKIRQMKNPFYNPIWAACITSRVKLRMAEHLRSMIKVHVDAMITTKPIETGPGPGEFRLIEHFVTKQHVENAVNRLENRLPVETVPRPHRTIYVAA